MVSFDMPSKYFLDNYVFTYYFHIDNVTLFTNDCVEGSSLDVSESPGQMVGQPHHSSSTLYYSNANTQFSSYEVTTQARPVVTHQQTTGLKPTMSTTPAYEGFEMGQQAVHVGTAVVTAAAAAGRENMAPNAQDMFPGFNLQQQVEYFSFYVIL